MLLYIVNIVSSVSESLLFYLFLHLFLQTRSGPVPRKALVFFLVANVHILMGCMSVFAVMRIICNIGVDLAFCCALFAGPLKKRLLLLGLFYVLVLTCETIVLTVFFFLAPELDPGTTLREFNMGIAALLPVLRLLQFLCIVFVKLVKSNYMPRKRWGGLLLMPALTFGFLWFAYPRFWSAASQETNELLIALGMFFVLQNFVILSYVASLQSGDEQYLQMKAAYERQSHYYATITAIQNTVRKMAHDIRHHFVVLRSALNRNDISKAICYLDELDQRLENIVPVNATGHCDVDALLHTMATTAEEQGIFLRVEGTLPPSLGISPVDLSMVLGNALQNALEAAGRVGEPQGTEIRAVFGYNHSRMSFTISNPYSGKIQRRPGGFLLSSKKEGGLGVEIMNQVVRKYGGALVTDTDDGIFRLTVIMHTPDKQAETDAAVAR